MRKLLLTFLTFGSISLSAATPSEFYLDLLHRGVAEVEGGRPQNATTLLRLAAFGLVESIEHYETAHVHLAVASDRIGDSESARDAAHRVVAAEKVERRYASLQIAAPVRTSFDAVAKKTLSATDLALLTAKPTGETTTVPQATVTPPKPAATTTTSANGSAPKPAAATTTAASTPKRPTPAPAPNSTQTASSTKPPAPAVQKPAATSVDTKPVTTTQKPASADPKPATTTQKPASTDTKPAITTQKPASTDTKPATTQKPASTDTKPVITTQKPASADTKPATTAQKPASADKPVTTTQKPAATTTNPPASVDVAAQLAAGDRALAAANLAEARRIYRTLVPVQTLDRRTLIRLGEGLYRSRDFATALQAFRRLGTLRSGEEPYHYYLAVAMYETGDYAGAKRELEAALPHIQITPDVQRYRAKIEGTR